MTVAIFLNRSGWIKSGKQVLILTLCRITKANRRKGFYAGLHFQNPPFEQGKLIRVVKGAVLDVAVDIRKNSATYGKWIAEKISEDRTKPCFGFLLALLMDF